MEHAKNKNMKSEKLKLMHFALLCKGHYEWPKSNKDQHANMWEYVKKALHADDYQPQTKEDITGILIANVTKHIKKDKDTFTSMLLNAIHPHGCYSVGYYTRDWQFAKGHTKRVRYDYQTAVLYFYIHHVRFMNVNEFGEMPSPDARVLPLSRKNW